MSVTTEPPPSDEQTKIIVGTRNSKLALVQTKHVIEIMKEHHRRKMLTFDLLSMSTIGDKILDKSLPKIGEKSLFTKELEVALEAREVQFVVHSLKDLPTTLPDGLVIGAVLEREDPRDALVLSKDFEGHELHSLPEKSVIGTSSLRRKAQLHSKYPSLSVESIRGNLSTRLRKLDEGGQYTGIILAMAGLNRMGWCSRVSKVLQGSEMMYAVGQGALAVECLEDDPKTLQLLAPLHHRETALQVVAERSFLHSLGGGCSAPVGVVSLMKDNGKLLELEGGVWSLDGKNVLTKKMRCSLIGSDEEPPKKKLASDQLLFCGIVSPASDVVFYTAAYQLGKDLANALINEGATSIMEEARKANEAS